MYESGLTEQRAGYLGNATQHNIFPDSDPPHCPLEYDNGGHGYLAVKGDIQEHFLKPANNF